MAAEEAAPLFHRRLASYSRALRAREWVQDADASTTAVPRSLSLEDLPSLGFDSLAQWTLYLSFGALCPKDKGSPLSWILKWNTGL